MTDNVFQARLERLLDRTEIFDMVRFERLCRDQRDFAGMVGCYVPNAPVRTTWFDGSVEDFAAASRKKMTSGSQAKHWIMPAPILYQTLEKHTAGRVLRNDQGKNDVPDPVVDRKDVHWDGLDENVKADDLFIDYFVRG